MTKKEAVLQAAKEVFGEYGFAEATFKKISERAGVALGLLAHHYSNKEKLFHTAGMDVLEHFLRVLQGAVAKGNDGYEASLNFCRAYLAFSIDPSSNWLVLVRCSPYSDMKAGPDRDIMFDKFTQVHRLLAQQIERGIADGSIRPMPATIASQIIVALQVGVNRTRVLTPYSFNPEELYEETINFVAHAIAPVKA